MIAGPATRAAAQSWEARLERLQDNPAKYCPRPLFDLKALSVRGERGFTLGLGRSMLPAMKVGALALIWRPPAGYAFKRGTVIFFRRPSGELWIKRLIGLPGDRIRYTAGRAPGGERLLINGAEVRHSKSPVSVRLSWIRRDGRGRRLAGPDGAPLRRTEAYQQFTETLANGTSYRVLHQLGERRAPDLDLVVPAGRYFVLGDNRARSYDSRWAGFGTIPRRAIVGIVLCDATGEEIMDRRRDTERN